jgi:hypothetical protein
LRKRSKRWLEVRCMGASEPFFDIAIQNAMGSDALEISRCDIAASRY